MIIKKKGYIVDGYWTNQVVATKVGSSEITPLYFSLCSQESPEFKSENVEIIKAFYKVGEAAGNKGIWVIDIGGYGERIFSKYPKNGVTIKKFIMEQNQVKQNF